jgi:hypothetical protein
MKALSSRFSTAGCPAAEETKLSGERVITRVDSFQSTSPSSPLGRTPPNPRDLTHYRQDCWSSAERAALARAESRPLSRRSGRVPAEPYPPLRCNQCSRKSSTNPKAVYTKLLTPPSYLSTLQHLPQLAEKLKMINLDASFCTEFNSQHLVLQLIELSGGSAVKRFTKF